MKRLFIWSAVIGIPLFNAVVFFIPWMRAHVMAGVAILAVAYGLLALASRRGFDLLLAIVVGGTFALARALFPDTDERTLVLRTSSITSFVFLNLVLLIGPWSRFSETVRGWYRHRRHLGVTTYFLAQLHFVLALQGYFSGNLANAFLSLFTFFGFTGYFLMFFLAMTSWDWQQMHIGLRRWTRIHLGVFLLYVASASYAFWLNITNRLPIAPWQWGALIAFFLAWYLMAPWGFAPKIIKQINGWKQLHVLLHIGYASVVLHAWFGVVIAQPPWLQIAFWSLVALIWGSHAAGWIIKWREDQHLREEASQALKTDIEGKPYWSVGRADAFVEGKGRRFLINENPIAVFKHQGKFFGLYAVCAHQKGPIEQGKIAEGYVQCPWHGRRYSCEDGKAPPGFTERLGFYPCVVQDGIVYVSQSPNRAS